MDLIGHYQIVSEIGQGAMGIVYKAKDIKLNRIVALKKLVIQPHLSRQEKEKFACSVRICNPDRGTGILPVVLR